MNTFTYKTALPLLFVLFSTLLLAACNKVNAKDIHNSNLSSQAMLEQTLSKHKGEVVYLDFWASWCVPCRRSFPWMNEIQEKYKQQGFSIVSVNLDANKALAEKFLLELPANFSVIYDPKGKIAKHFKIQGMPSSMLIGRDGKIKSRHTGFFIDKIPQYQQEIEQLLKNK